MFHFVNTVLKDLAEEDVHSSWKEDCHFFIQWHGMAETSCLESDAFISTGIKNSSIYDRDIPATKLMKSFNKLAAELGVELNASTPRQDQLCTLTAGTNIFGRYINGVSRLNVCGTPAKEEVRLLRRKLKLDSNLDSPFIMVKTERNFKFGSERGMQ
ncbi:unnamed protein product [Strongylus vulgaris]|uniref:Uncharacterized protein n=1 Tax=Strongylus vulgaris TaxID=40348 RepID=A0A3P7IEL0_STRVU|nr:unnamed protein product [Strongylus vulgaris]